MITIQHTLVTYLGAEGDITGFRTRLPYALLPDAIRMYTGDRQYSHFEIGIKGDVSWIQFPSDLHRINKNSVDQLSKHLTDSSERPKCCVGEETQIAVFEQTNRHLPETAFGGIAMHLIQDFIFDDFVRTEFDCSARFEDQFGVQGRTVGGKEFRQVIMMTEQQGYYLLAKRVYEQYGITANQEWLHKNVLPLLEQAYPSEMAANTFKYMTIEPQINQWITDHDFTHTGDFLIPEERLQAMYDRVLREMNSYEEKIGTMISQEDQGKKLNGYDVKTKTASYDAEKKDLPSASLKDKMEQAKNNSEKGTGTLTQSKDAR